MKEQRQPSLRGVEVRLIKDKEIADKITITDCSTYLNPQKKGIRLGFLIHNPSSFL